MREKINVLLREREGLDDLIKESSVIPYDPFNAKTKGHILEVIRLSGYRPIAAAYADEYRSIALGGGELDLYFGTSRIGHATDYGDRLSFIAMDRSVNEDDFNRFREEMDAVNGPSLTLGHANVRLVPAELRVQAEDVTATILLECRDRVDRILNAATGNVVGTHEVHVLG